MTISPASPSRKFSVTVAAAVFLATIACWLWSNSRAATKTPRYTLVRTDGPLEIRDYPQLTIVTAPMTGNGMNAGFRTLFRYITGSNERAEKIEMTTPVLIDSAAGNKSMAFIMPAATVALGVPQPLEPAASIARLNPARMAVLRFGGRRGAANEARAVDTLRAFLSAIRLTPAGDPVIAYYDPPWTPLFLRRNEVMIPVSA